jgi:GNAT superfamily N-acetyltransferase
MAQIDRSMETQIRHATEADIEVVSAILREAADWLTDQRMPMWRADELLPERIAHDVRSGQFYLGERAGAPAGTIKFQLSDTEFWPDVRDGESAFVHRLAIRRRYAGHGVSTALLSWALEHARELGRDYLRLDCEASRHKLRAVYEAFGFHHHSDRQVGPYFVARYQRRVVPGEDKETGDGPVRPLPTRSV